MRIPSQCTSVPLLPCRAVSRVTLRDTSRSNAHAVPALPVVARQSLLRQVSPPPLRGPLLWPSSFRVRPPAAQALAVPYPSASTGMVEVVAGGSPADSRTDVRNAAWTTPALPALDRGVINPIPVHILTPVIVPAVSQLLVAHPDRSRVHFILSGFTVGFDISFRGLALPSRPKNLRSARDQGNKVTQAVTLERSRGHTAGPFLVPPFPCLHCSPLGAAPKKDGTVRLVLDLSSPRGASVNDDISKDDFAVSYSSFDEAVQMVREVGSGAFMAKLDIKHAFRLCPVRLDQLHLLGFTWEGFYFVDLRLPFGSRSSPFIFNQFADLLAWIFMFVGSITFLLHYLDDFLIVAASRTTCGTNMHTMLAICDYLGVPVAHDKTVGPETCLTYLGIEIDAVEQVMRLPDDKLRKLSQLLSAWTSKRKCTKRDLLSLIGSLSFAAKVVQPGRLFLRRLIHLSTTVDRLSHFLYIDAEARADILWWHSFLQQWNGVQFIPAPPISSQEILLASDASKIGIGAVFGSAWFSTPLPPHISQLHINILELFAVFAAIRTWGQHWENQHLLFLCDNNCVVHVAKTGSCKDKIMMRILRAMFYFTVRRNIRITFQHIPGIDNLQSDLLSRLQVQRFRQLSPSADAHPSVVPQDTWDVFSSLEDDS